MLGARVRVTQEEHRCHPVDNHTRWRPGQDVIIPPAVSDEQAKQQFPGGWRTVKPYLRVVAQPKE
jgi:hypothetical protein